MTIWHAAFVTLAWFGAMGTCYWAGQAIRWVWMLYTRDDELPPPTADERDGIAKFRRIVDKELS